MINVKAQIEIKKFGMNLSEEFDLSKIKIIWGESGEFDLPLSEFLSNISRRISVLEEELSNLTNTNERGEKSKALNDQ